MTLHSAILKDTTKDGDAEFGFDELIYSRTDTRGVIQSGNSVFQRMCAMPFSELVGAPHRVIRHPDMPRGFFHLFWTELQAGHAVIGYVRNRRATGGFYWVLAAAIPCEGGYFSVRMRPSSPLFHRVTEIYARLLAEEAANDLTPEASSKRLLQLLAEAGYPDYPSLAVAAISSEMSSRNAAFGRENGSEHQLMQDLISNLEAALAEQDGLTAKFRELMLLPVNMRLVATRLEPQGGPISQISVNYKLASEEISARLASFSQGKNNLCLQMAQTIRHSVVLSGCASLQTELVRNYDRVADDFTGEERRKELEVLTKVQDSCVERAHVALADAAHKAGILNAASLDLRRMILGLDTIRILGRVESRKVVGNGEALAATIDQIDKVQAAISQSLKSMMDKTATISQMLNSLSAASRKPQFDQPRTAPMHAAG